MILDRMKLGKVGAPVESFQKIRLEKVHADSVVSLSFAPMSNLLATGGRDGKVGVWDVNQKSLLKTFDSGGGPVLSVSFCADPSVLFIANNAKEVYAWNLKDEKKNRCWRNLKESVSNIAFSKDKHWMAWGFIDGRVLLNDRKCLAIPKYFQPHLIYITGISFSADNSRIATSSMDGDVHLWARKTGASIARFREHTYFANSVCFTPDERFLISASADRTIRIWDIVQKRRTGVLTGHTGYVRYAAITPDGSTIISTGDDGTLRFWDFHTCKEIINYYVSVSGFKSLAIAPNGRLLALGTGDGEVWVWERNP